MCDQKGACTRWMYPGLVFIVITFIYGTFIAINMYPQIQRHYLLPSDHPADPHAVTADMGEIVGVMIGFHIVFIMVLISYFRAMLTSPGYIPETSFWKEGDFVILERHNALIRELINDQTAPITEEAKAVIRSLPVVERKQKSGKFRFCKACGCFKPDRSHHCSICGKCVLRMDHHCPWVNNCIGYSNYKYFMQLLVYLDVTLLFLVGALMPRFINVFKPILSWPNFLKYDLPIILAFTISVFLMGALLGFTWYHLTLIAKALTTIEAKEKVNSRDETIKRRWEIANVKYQMDTVYLNFRHVLGSPLFWLLPFDVNGMDEDAGTYRYGPWVNIDNHAGGNLTRKADDNMGKYFNI